MHHPFCGIHILGEFYGIDAETLSNTRKLYQLLKESVLAAGATILTDSVMRLDPGVTVALILAESHATIHTYPEEEAMFVDIFTCGERCNPKKAINYLKEKLNPEDSSIEEIQRGNGK